MEYTTETLEKALDVMSHKVTLKDGVIRMLDDESKILRETIDVLKQTITSMEKRIEAIEYGHELDIKLNYIKK